LALCLCGLCGLAVAYRAHRRGKKDMAKVRVKQRSDETTPCRACASSSSADEEPFEATAAAPAPAKGGEEKEEGGASSGASLSSSRDHSFASAGESKHGGDDAGSLEEWKYPRVSESAGRPSSMTADDASQSTLRARKTRDQAKKERKNSAKDPPTTAAPPPGRGRLAPLAVSPSSAGNKAGGALPPLLSSPLSSPRGGAVGPAQVRAWAAVAEHMKAEGVDAAQVLKAVVRASGADTVTQAGFQGWLTANVGSVASQDETWQALITSGGATRGEMDGHDFIFAATQLNKRWLMESIDARRTSRNRD